MRRPALIIVTCFSSRERAPPSLPKTNKIPKAGKTTGAGAASAGAAPDAAPITPPGTDLKIPAGIQAAGIQVHGWMLRNNGRA
jgi:hypothetical protein